MNILPKAGPTIVPTPSAKTESQAAARERAIALLTAKVTPKVPQTQETPVLNPTKVTAEELSAIAPKAEPKEEVPETIDQNDTSVETKLDEEAAKPEAEKEQLSSQFAVLARKEKALRAQVQKLNADREAFKAEQATKQDYKSAFDESKYVSRERLSTDLLNTLLESGVSFDQLAQTVANPPPPQDPATKAYITKLEARLAAIEEKSGKVEQNFQDQQNNSYKQALNQIKSEASNLVKSDPAFETIQATNSVDDVVDLIEQTFKKDGVLLTVEEAATEVESYLVEEAMKIARLKKIQSRLQPSAQNANPPKATDVADKKQMKTLTNSVNASRPLTSKERAILAFKGELKK